MRNLRRRKPRRQGWTFRPTFRIKAETKEALKEEREAKKLAKKSKRQEKAEAKEDRRKGKKSPKEGKRSYEGPSSQICRQEEQ